MTLTKEQKRLCREAQKMLADRGRFHSISIELLKKHGGDLDKAAPELASIVKDDPALFDLMVLDYLCGNVPDFESSV